MTYSPHMPKGNADELRSLPGLTSVALLCGFLPIIIYISTGDNFCTKTWFLVSLFSICHLSLSKKVHGSVKCLFGMPLKGQQPLFSSILLAPGILADMEHQKTMLMVIEMVAPACDHQSNLLIS